MRTSSKAEIAGTIKEFLAQKNIAVAGASRNPKKFGNIIFNDLLKKGYKAFPVNPNATEVDGHKCFANLCTLPAEVESVVFITPPDQTLTLLKEAMQTKIKYFWLQQGAENPEVINFCEEHNLKFISNRCILLHLEPVTGFHSVHKFISKLFGTYPS
jgi:uncharacterized protein